MDEGNPKTPGSGPGHPEGGTWSRTRDGVDILLERVGRVMVASPQIETLMAKNSRALKGLLEGLVEPGGALVLDLGRVKFLDSSAMGVILSTLKGLMGQGGAMRLCRITPSVRSILALVKIDRFLQISETREEAIESLEAQGGHP